MKDRHKAGIFTTGEAARLCGMVQGTLIRCIDKGILKSFKVPGSTHRRVRLEDLKEFAVAHNIPLGDVEGVFSKPTPPASPSSEPEK